MSTNGGKNMKNNVIGSRQTMMNSLNKIAPSPRNGRDFIAKLQVPSSKPQRSSKYKIPNCSRAPWDLVLGIFLELGIWFLGFLRSCCFLFLLFGRLFRAQRHKNIFE